MGLGFMVLKLGEVLHGEPDLELKFVGKMMEGKKNRECRCVPLEVSNTIALSVVVLQRRKITVLCCYTHLGAPWLASLAQM